MAKKLRVTLCGSEDSTTVVLEDVSPRQENVIKRLAIQANQEAGEYAVTVTIEEERSTPGSVVWEKVIGE